MLFGRKKTEHNDSQRVAEETASVRPARPDVIRRILVVMDSSSRAAECGAYAVKLAAALNSELLAVYVVDVPSMDYLVRLNYFSAAERMTQEQEMSARGERVLQQLEEEALLHGVSFQSFCLRGSRWQLVLQTAREQRADMIVLKDSKDIATRKDHSAVDRLLLMDHAECPVLVCNGTIGL